MSRALIGAQALRVLRQDLARLGRRREKTLERVLVRGREGFAEHIAGHRHRPARAERLLDVGHLDRAAEAPPLEIGAEIPEFERRLGLALGKFLRDERRRAVGRPRILGKVEARAERRRPQEEPALVDRSAGDADGPAREIGERMDRRILACHHRAQRARIGREHELVAEPSFARHPKPIPDNHVGRAALERDLGRLGGGKFGRLDVEVRRFVETARLHQRRFPTRRFRFSGSQCAGGRRLRRCMQNKRSQTKRGRR